MDRVFNLSWHSYLASKEVERRDFPFYAIIVAAMKKADDDNLRALKHVFPGLFEQALERYNQPMGMSIAELAKTDITPDRYKEVLEKIEEEFK